MALGPTIEDMTNALQTLLRCEGAEIFSKSPGILIYSFTGEVFKVEVEWMGTQTKSGT